jgi:hypothetical protein
MIPWLYEERRKVSTVREGTMQVDGVHYCHITPERLSALLAIATAAVDYATGPITDDIGSLQDAVQEAEGLP